MITAHLPAGYLTGRVMAAKGPLLWAAIIGGVFPDLDLIWFFLVDDRALHHHHYWVHIPGFWAAVAAFGLTVIKVFKPRLLGTALAFLAGVSVHLLLDSIAGDVKWLWPFSDAFFHLVTVPARYDNWIWNFVLHPIFLLEILIWMAAMITFRRSRKTNPRPER